MKLEKLIADCGKNNCPLYSKFFNQPNAQSSYRIEQFCWSNSYFSKKRFQNKGDFGAKLILIMESPPPKFNEYFYGDEGGFEKEAGLFSCFVQAIIKAEGKPKSINWADSELALKYAKDKSFWLSWISGLGILILDASKCRLKISDAFQSDKVSSSEMCGSFFHCRDILKLQISNINPFRIAIGIASVFDTKIIDTICDELDISGCLINKRIKSPFRGNKENFIRDIENLWIAVNDDFFPIT